MSKVPVQCILAGQQFFNFYELFHPCSYSFQLFSIFHVCSYIFFGINSAYVFCGRVYSLDAHCMREESGKETNWSQTLRKNWRIWTHLRSMQNDSMQGKC